MNYQEILMQDYDYDLPSSKIAQHALEPRDSSKLLIFKNEKINDSVFNKLSSYIPQNSLLVYNDAKVIPARLIVQKSTGTAIELFLLQPYDSDYFTSLNATTNAQWECLIGNKKKWKEDELLTTVIQFEKTSIQVTIQWINREQNIVQMKWNDNHKFIDLLEHMGKMPLPPYIKRDVENNDQNRYQTIYSNTQGSVAAPTAGLHFTENVIEELKHNNIVMTPLTLHVSAGTFLPVSVEKPSEHAMHQEIFSFNKTLLLQLLSNSKVIAVGTTSVRVLESLYWCAVNLHLKNEQPFKINKLLPYHFKHPLISREDAIQQLLDYMELNKIETITGATSILILPGYEFRLVKGLITNFHQPKSTLILLIAAFIGPHWRAIYHHALANNYRFLSYGDSSLLLK